MAIPMRNTDFRSIVEPILNKEFDGLYEQRTDEYKECFKEFDGIPRNFHEEPVLFGFGAAPILPDGQPVTYQAGGTLFIKRYVYQVIGLAFGLTKVLVEDGDHIRIGKIFAQHLAQSMIETKETYAANVINRAFNGSYVGGDNVALAVSNHPLANGLTASNLLTSAAALSQTSLEQMLVQIRNAVDNSGKRIRLEPDKIVGGPSLVFQAEVLLKSVLRTGTQNNDINPVKSMGMLSGGQANLSRQTSATQWGIKIRNVHMGLQSVMRRHLEKSAEGDFETDTMRYKSTERYDIGWTDWRDYWATPGL